MPFRVIKAVCFSVTYQAVCFSVTYKAVQSIFSRQRYNRYFDKSNKICHLIIALTIFHTRV